jgi:hypothetical protein
MAVRGTEDDIQPIGAVPLSLLWSSPTVTVKILRSVAARLQQVDPQVTA